MTEPAEPSVQLSDRRDRRVYVWWSVGFGLLLSKRSEILEELDALVRRDGLTFACLMATDVTRETSLLLIKGDGRVLASVTYPRKEEGIFEMKDVLSRKKQVLPYLLDILKKI